GGKGTENGKFDIVDILFAYEEKIYVSDYADNSISIFDLKGNFLMKFIYKNVCDEHLYCHNIMIFILNRNILIYYENLWGEYFKIFDLDGVLLQDVNRHYITYQILLIFFNEDISDIINIF
ncbi:unnamed protein product, partial [marine sediment metagenome]